MLDYSRIEQYRENNRIEAKKAAGGLPRSIWETYSAFANTIGGVILLGVEELPDHSLRPVHLPHAEQLVSEFWELINSPAKVSVNILTEQDVIIHEQDNCKYISITVPRAHRYDKPVYIDNNPLKGTYRRNGEGDYKCTPEAIQAMLRDAAAKTQDMTVLDSFALTALDADSIRRYRIRMKNHRPGHAWETLNDPDFLCKLGAAGISEDGEVHPTIGGLLMFGFEYEITRQFPAYFLDYQERMSDDTRWTDRLVSSSGDWSGNLFDFYFRVCSRLDDAEESHTSAVRAALREALANSLINADYYGSRGLVIIHTRDSITMSNPGSFRIPLDNAKSGGLSDPRNTALMKMFNLVNVSESTGNGLPGIFNVWKKQGWAEPVLKEELSPERITLTLPLHSGDDAFIINKRTTKVLTANQKEQILQYLTEHVSASSAELSNMLDIKRDRVRRLLSLLRAEGYVVPVGNGRSRNYKLKA